MEGGTPVLWAQMGYARSRGYVPGTLPTQIVKRVFAETYGGPGNVDIFSPFEAVVVAGNPTYEVLYWFPAFGNWRYWYPDTKTLFHSVSNSGWFDLYGNNRTYAAEVWNVDDDMVGIEGNKARWDQCEYQVIGGVYEPVDFLQGWTPQTSHLAQWGIQVLNGQTFEVWDKIP